MSKAYKDGPHLFWEGKHNERITREAGDCLWEFVSLARNDERAPERVLEFAKKWGVLAIDRFPNLKEEVVAEKRRKDGSLDSAAWKGMVCTGYREPIATYVIYAQQVRAFLLAAALLREKKSVPDSEWAKIFYPVTDGGDPVPEGCFFGIGRQPDWQEQRWMLGQFFTSFMLKYTCIHPRLNWWLDSDAPTLEFDASCEDELNWWRHQEDLARMPHWRRRVDLDHRQIEELARHFRFFERRPSHLFDVLVLQLGAVLSSPSGVYRCDREGCGMPFARPEKKPQAGRNAYCSEACRKIAHRVTEKRSREKRRGKAESPSGGT